MNFFKSLQKKIYQNFRESISDIIEETGVREKNLESFLSERGLSEFLMYRDYYETDESDCGIYLMSNGSKAFIMRIVPPAYVSSKTEERLASLFSSIGINETVVQILTFASRNIEKHLERYRNFHSAKNVNIDNPLILKDIVEKRISELRRWTKETMSSGTQFKIKDFHNLLVITHPEETDDDVIYKKYAEVQSLLSEFSPMNYNADSLLSILSEMFYFDKDPTFWDTKFNNSMEMNQQIVSGGVEINTGKDFQGFRANNKTYYKVLTTKSFPSDLSLFDYNNAFFDKMGTSIKIPISTSFLISLTLVFDDVKKRKEKVLSKLNHDIGELSKLRPIDLKKRPDLKERLRETEDSIYLLREANEIPIKGMWTLTIMDTNKKALEDQVFNIKKSFGDLDWEITEEYSNNISLMTFLFSLPGQFAKVVEEKSKRFRVLFKSNHASMSPILGDSLGVGDYNLLTVGRSGQIQRFDPFTKGAAGNPNIVKAGGSGSGKSFSESEFQCSSLSAGYLLRVIDAGGSYESLCRMVGGQYIEFREDVELSLNFFTKARTVVKDGKIVLHPEELSSITSIIGLIGGVNLAQEFRVGGDVDNVTKVGVFTETIMKAVNTAFERAAFSAKLEDVRDIIIEMANTYKQQQRGIADSLENFAGALYRFADVKGPFYKYFNPPNNVNLDKDYVVIETQSLLNLSNDLFVVVVAILTNQIKNEFFDPQNIEKRKILTVDEAKPILDNSISLEMLIQIYRKIRKYNGLANTITQSINDFFSNDDVKVLYEIAGWRWFLKQNEGVISTAVSEGKLSVNRFEQRLLESIKNNPPSYGEYYIDSEKVSMLSRLKADSLTYWIYTTDGTDKMKIKSYMDKYSLSELDARKFLSLLTDGVDSEIALSLVKRNIIREIDEEEVLMLCQRYINQAINNPALIDVYSLDVFNKNTNEVIYSELFSDITNSDGITPKELYSNRNKISNFNKYDEVLLKKLLEFVSKRKGNFAINVSLEALSNNEIYKIAEEFAYKNEEIASRVIFEAPLAKLGDNGTELIRNSLISLKNIGYRIANDNLENNHRLLNILTFDVDFIKLSPSVYANEEESIEAEITLSAIEKINKSKNIKVIAVTVEDEAKRDAAYSHDYIDYVQGFILSKKEKVS